MCVWVCSLYMQCSKFLSLSFLLLSPVTASRVPAFLILAPMATSLCSSSSGSVSSSPSSVSMFCNLEVAWFSVTTFLSCIYLRPCVLVPKVLLGIYWFCMWHCFNQSESRPDFLCSPNLLWTILFYAWLSERGKNYYYFKHCSPTYPWQEQNKLNWNRKHFKI